MEGYLSSQESERLCTQYMCVRDIEYAALSTFFGYILELFRQCDVTTKVVSSSPVHGEVYSIQQVGGFLRVLLFPPPINRHDILKYC
jgi:hypothetical protein